MSSILVVEDEQQVRSLIKETLELGGYPDINVVGSGKEAVQFCQERVPDLVITDLVMPDMDGLQLIRSLRKSDSNLRIVAISGAAVNNLLKMAIALGAIGTLGKPFTANELLAMVDKILGKQRGGEKEKGI
jgi:CheY-like chemotaxis protein